MTRGRGLGYAAHRTVLGRGVVFRDPYQQAGDRQAGETAEEQVLSGETLIANFAHANDPIGHRPQGHGRQNGGNDEAFVHRAHDVLTAAQLHKKGANYRGDDAGPTNGQGIQHHLPR